MTPTYGVNPRDGHRIRDMRAVPRQKEVQPVDRGCRDVKRIFVRFSRDTCPCHQRSGKIDSVACHRCKPQLSRHGDPLSGDDSITALGFAQHNSRDVELEVLAMRLPPLPRELLVRGDARVPAGPSNQVADDTRFDVHRRKHETTLTDRGLGKKFPNLPPPFPGAEYSRCRGPSRGSAAALQITAYLLHRSAGAFSAP